MRFTDSLGTTGICEPGAHIPCLSSVVSVMNSIRRVILADIPNVAFDFQPYDFEQKKVNIIENTCSLHNEIILQRLSMIPLKFDENEIHNFEPSKYNFRLKKVNNTNKLMNVTTEHIEIYDERVISFDALQYLKISYLYFFSFIYIVIY